MNLYTRDLKNEISELIMIDGYDVNKDELFILIKQVLSTKIYIDSIINDLNKIFEDKKITQDDLPRMMMISLKLNNLLSTSLYIKNKIDSSKMKYILYSILYCYIMEKQEDFFKILAIEEFRLLFNNLWILLEVDPKKIKISVTKYSSLCCNNSSIKE
jgi:hypothetical protein